MKSEKTKEEEEMESGSEGGKRIQRSSQALKCNCCQHHVPRTQKHSISCPKYLPHMSTEGPKDIEEGELVFWMAQSEESLLKYQKAEEKSLVKIRPQQQPKEEVKLVDVRLIHESIGRDLKCNSCQHHVPKSLKHSILCRKYSPHENQGPPGTCLYRCFTSCPNCFDEWELWPNNRHADSFDVLSGATYQEIIPEPNPNSGQT